MDLLKNNISSGRFQEETPTQLLKQQIKTAEFWSHYYVQLFFCLFVVIFLKHFYWQEAHKITCIEYLSTTPSFVKSNAKPKGAAEE